MRISTTHSIRRNRRSGGFTLVELLVVIAIIGTLVALLLPAIGAARQTARKAQCLNGMKQIGTGMINYDTQKGRFPGYVQSVKRSDGSYLLIHTGGGVANSHFESTPGTTPADRAASWVSWAGVLTPELERQDIFDSMQEGTVNSFGTHSDARGEIRPIEILVCPSDTELSGAPGSAGLSYSVNAGCWDYDGTNSPNDWLDPKITNQGDTKANGMCHNRSLGKLSSSISGVRDGASTTILLAENIHKEIESADYTWMGVEEVQFAEQQFGIVWVVNDQPSSGSNGPTSFTFQQPFSNDGNAGGFPIDSPAFARPSSAHAAGVFNTIFVDGHAQSIAPDIDYTVYQRLMTPNGRECVDPTDHTLVNSGDPIFDFRQLAPLSEDDF